MIDLYFKPTNKDAKRPIKAHERDAGFDLYATEEVVVHPGEKLKLSSGISVLGKFTNPEDAKKWIIEAKVEGTSGNASKLGLFPIGGIVDEGYTGEVGIVIVNHTPEPVKILKGNKIAQLVIHVIPHINKVIYLGEDEDFPIAKTDRGENGFGSTGTANS